MKKRKKTSALVLLSGGQDSTTALCWALKKFDTVTTLSFDFGQIHIRELKCAKNIAEICNVPHRIIPLRNIFDSIRSCSLLSDAKKGKSSKKFPATFVPGRNLVFLNVAAISAFSEDIRDIVIGVSQMDYSGYPDCRENFIKSTQKTLSFAFDEEIHIHAPFLFRSKAEEIQLMQEYGMLELLRHTHTCYKGENPPCQKCDACILRYNAFVEVGIKDPLISYNPKKQKSFE